MFILIVDVESRTQDWSAKMKRMRNAALVVLVAIAMFNGVTSGNEILLSDNFNRSDSSVDIGKTDQGYAWIRRDISPQSPQNAPGIKDGQLFWANSGKAGSDVLSVKEVRIRDFVMDFDYIRHSRDVSSHSIVVCFRMRGAGAMLSDGGKTTGYQLAIRPADRKSLQVSLSSEYGVRESATVQTGQMKGHLTIVAKGNVIKVYMNDPDRQHAPAIEVTDTSENPAAATRGYFSFGGNRWRTAAIDNLVIKGKQPTRPQVAKRKDEPTPFLKYTGNVIPKPQNVIGDWQSIDLSDVSLVTDIDSESHKAVKLAKSLLDERFKQVAGNDKSTAKKIVIHLGTFLDKNIQAAAKEMGEDLSKTVLPAEGYILRKKEQGETVQILAAGVEHRGAFYAAATLIQQVGLEDGKPILKYADMDDWPVWKHRYASDYGTISDKELIRFALAKINAYAIQHRTEWRHFSAEHTTQFDKRKVYGKELARMKRFRDEYDLFDYMLVINIYARRKGPFFDITNEQHVSGLIERFRFAASAGVDHIMVCVDDHTPNKAGVYICPNETEREHFDNSVGRAHGYLMKRLHETLKKEYPNLGLSICPPVYSYRGHLAHSKAHRRAYLRDLSMELPEDVSVVWTGNQICSKVHTRDVYLKYVNLIGNQRNFIWDNSNCFGLPLPRWHTKFYDGAETDFGGMIYLNGKAVGIPWLTVFALNANDYLWNPKGYEMRSSHRNATGKLFGAGKYHLVETFCRSNALLDKVHKLPPAAASKAVEQARKATKSMQAAGLPVRWLNRKVDRVGRLVGTQVSSLEIPRVSQSPSVDGKPEEKFWENAASFDYVAHNAKRKLASPTRGRIAYDDENLYLAFEMKHTKPLPVPVISQKHDDQIFANSDAIEIFIQPRAGGRYVHLAFDHLGNTYDMGKHMQPPISWEPQWTVRIHKASGVWTAEVIFPFSSLQPLIDDAPQGGELWRVNFCRENGADGELSTWSPMVGQRFHTPALFGKVTFK